MSQNVFTLQISSLHHYKGNSQIVFYYLPEKILKWAPLVSWQISEWHSTSADMFWSLRWVTVTTASLTQGFNCWRSFWPRRRGSSHNPGMGDPMGLSLVTYEAGNWCSADPSATHHEINLWQWKSTTVNTKCDIQKTKCQLKSS